MDETLSGILAFLAAYAVSRFVSERGLAKLQPDEKLRLIDAFAMQRRYRPFVLVAVLAAVFAFPRRISPVLLLLGVAMYLVASGALAVTKLRRIGMPTAYIQNHVAGQGVLLGGFAIYGVLIAGWLAR